MMRKAITVTSFVLVLLLTAMALTAPAFAEGFGFAVNPILPASQRAETQSYFDLLVKPGDTENLSISVVNQSDKDIKVSVKAITAFTNLNGVIDYSSPGESDESMKHSFADMTTVAEPEMTIPPGETKEVSAVVKIPEEPFEGILLGSFYILKELTDEDKQTGGAIINQYAYVVAVKIRESEAAIAPEFEMGGVTAELLYGKASIVANVRNPQPEIFKAVKATAQIYPKDSDTPIMELTNEAVDFAPNSIFPFTMLDEAGYGINAGEYTAKINLQYDGRDWDFSQEFEVMAEKAADINQQANNQIQQRQTAATIAGGIPIWVVVSLIGGGIIILMLVALLIVHKRNQDLKTNKMLEEMLNNRK